MKYSLFMLCLRLFYFSYFAIVRRTVTFCPRSALRCLPSSLFAAELITNDKVVEISPLAGLNKTITCLVLVEAVSVPIT